MSRANPLPWLSWSAAAMLLVVLTRNPVLLGLSGLAIMIVRVSNPSEGGAERLSWWLIIRIAGIVASVSVVFNLLTVHVGDRTFAHLPKSIPIIGGALTMNAFIYGLAGGLALMDLILVAATFSTVVDRGELIQLLPASFGAAGTATIVALSIFPQTLRAVREVHDAQASRGFRIRSIRDVEPLVVPVLHLGLEHAFELAESIEARGFGRGQQRDLPWDRPIEQFALPFGLALATGGIVMAGLGRLFPGCIMVGVGVLVPFLFRRSRVKRHPGRYRPRSWTGSDKLIIVSSASSSILLLIALIFTSSLEYSPYPTLDWPRLSLLPLIAAVLFVIPAISGSTPKVIE